ncbi:MAG: hypothetical protein LBO81_00145 [Clostridiales Family XIII bacterium]|nr:hypothetical protein [Clostridiales Family XIII bacterium]
MRVMLSNLEYFDLADARGGETVKGGDQDWYGSWWRRMSGCGPTTATNVILYLTNARARAPEAGDAATPGAAGAAGQSAAPAKNRAPEIREKEEFIRLMNRVWKYVTPGRGGVNSTAKLRRGIAGYAAAEGLRLRTEAMDIADARAERPPLAHVAAFIQGGLARDLPVAFLNLHNGLELQLEKWHWVTITGLACEADGAVRVEILDNCNLLDVNLGRWLSSAARGGGFVRFSE